MTNEQAIFEAVQKFQTAYNRAVAKKRRQIKTLREIGGKSVLIIKDVETHFDSTLLEIQKRHGTRVRHYVSLIADESIKKQVRYKVNMCIRHPEKCDTFKSKEEFYHWCGVDGILTDEVNNPP